MHLPTHLLYLLTFLILAAYTSAQGIELPRYRVNAEKGDVIQTGDRVVVFVERAYRENKRWASTSVGCLSSDGGVKSARGGDIRVNIAKGNPPRGGCGKNPEIWEAHRTDVGIKLKSLGEGQGRDKYVQADTLRWMSTDAPNLNVAGEITVYSGRYPGVYWPKLADRWLQVNDDNELNVRSGPWAYFVFYKEGSEAYL